MSSWLARAVSRLSGRGPLARIAINLPPRRSPYGGGNQFVQQLGRCLAQLGFDVAYRLRAETDVVLIVEVRDELASIRLSDVAAWSSQGPGFVIHRINECDARKGTNTIDGLLARANQLAHHSVFLSAWLREHHSRLWFDSSRPSSVILSGADASVFHPLGARGFAPGDVFRVVTHHWSDHPLKGFAIYEAIDHAIADGRLPGFELMVVGRWPAAIRWRTARLVEPTSAAPLARLLRSAHGYVTASRWEPGGMHVAEALQCGLPVAHHQDGGGIAELVGDAGVQFRDDVCEALLLMRERYVELRRAALAHHHSGGAMSLRYARIIQGLLAEPRPTPDRSPRGSS